MLNIQELPLTKVDPPAMDKVTVFSKIPADQLQYGQVYPVYDTKTKKIHQYWIHGVGKWAWSHRTIAEAFSKKYWTEILTGEINDRTTCPKT